MSMLPQSGPDLIALRQRMQTSYTVSGSGCWEWRHARTKLGYGRLMVGRKNWSAHRLMFALVRGEDALGPSLDHLCRNPCCINPDHLESVSPAENTRRACEARAKAFVTPTDAPTSHRDIVDLWPKAEALAATLGIENSGTVCAWRWNGIPAERFPQIVEAAKTIGRSDITLLMLYALAPVRGKRGRPRTCTHAGEAA